MYSKKWSFKLTEWLKFSLFGYFLAKHPKSGIWQPNSILEILFSPRSGIGFHESFSRRERYGRARQILDPSNNHWLLKHLLGNLSTTYKTVIENVVLRFSIFSVVLDSQTAGDVFIFVFHLESICLWNGKIIWIHSCQEEKRYR